MLVQNCFIVQIAFENDRIAYIAMVSSESCLWSPSVLTRDDVQTERGICSLWVIPLEYSPCPNRQLLTWPPPTPVSSSPLGTILFTDV